MSIVILPMTSFGHFSVEAEQERAEMEATPAVWMFEHFAIPLLNTVA